MEEGVACLKKADEYLKTNIDVKVKMAGVLFREFNRFTEVQEIAHQVLKMQPKNSEILVLMGRVREKFEKPMEALEYYQQSIEVLQAVQPIDEKSLANSYFLLGQIHEKLKDFKKCAMSLKKCLTYDKRHFGACILLANLLASIGEGGRALKYFQHALKIDPESDNAHYGMGKTLQQFYPDRKGASIPHFEYIAKKDQNNYKVLA